MNMKPLASLWLFLCGAVYLFADADRTIMSGSLAPTYIGSKAATAGTVTRQTLTASEMAAEQPTQINRKMRNFDELQARVQRGEVLSREELAARPASGSTACLPPCSPGAAGARAGTSTEWVELNHEAKIPHREKIIQHLKKKNAPPAITNLSNSTTVREGTTIPYPPSRLSD